MDDDDIVPRLRLWAEGVQNQKAVVLAVAITEAADEIERLRAEIDRKNLTIQALTEERDEVVRMANKLTAERDEARREACGSDGGTIGEAMLEARQRGWDCFKEEQ
jgi:HAMP domain-containing protein